jgi:hypothetical protein
LIEEDTSSKVRQSLAAKNAAQKGRLEQIQQSRGRKKAQEAQNGEILMCLLRLLAATEFLYPL